MRVRVMLVAKGWAAGKIWRRCDRYPPLEGVRDPWGSEHAELCEAEHA